MAKEWVRVRNGTDFERDYGYCRAVRVGGLVLVSGTTPAEGALGAPFGEQFASACARIEEALAEVGAAIDDVVRTVVYVRDLRDPAVMAAAHRAVFATAEPVSTVVEVSRLAPEAALVEVEVTAVVPERAG